VTPATDALCRSFGLDVPILQAGMGYVSTGRLAAAVSAAGGLGVIATGGVMAPAELTEHIARVRDEAPGKPFAVNLLLPGGSDPGVEFGSPELTRSLLDVCVGERVPAAVIGLGDPRAVMGELKDAGAHVVGVVGSPRAARNVAEAGADLVIVQGREAGGHVGEIGTLTLLQTALRELECPVAVAGGIATSQAVAGALAAGAAGVSVGTRFLASEESDAHALYKQAVVDAHARSTAVTRACSGKPGRALRSPFVEAWIGRDEEIDPYPARAEEHYWRARAGMLEGDWDNGYFPAGQCVEVIDEVLPAAQIVEELATLAVAP
jgi:enoyl-[acyl-carrier protein] reductase II